MTEHELLQRIAATLREDIGPAVAEEYPKTQAFMASVVLQKLALQLARAEAHAAAAESDLAAMLRELPALLGPGPAPARVTEALAGLAGARDADAACRLIEALYTTRGELGEERFGTLLRRIRSSLRREIDRRLEYSA